MKVSIPSESPRHISQEGRYFEIRVEEIVPGWVGGLGIGVAQQPSQNIDGLKRLPDKAWRIPKTTVVGDLVKGPGGWDDGGWVMMGHGATFMQNLQHGIPVFLSFFFLFLQAFA